MNNTTSLQDNLQDKKKLNELEQWLNEDKSICKADRKYISNCVSSLLQKQRDKIKEKLLIKGPIGGFENSFNNRIKEVFNNLIDNKDE